MKKFITLYLISTLFLAVKVQAQPQLWGSTEQGGKYDAGVLFTTDINGENYTVEYHFPKIMGYEFTYSTLTQASNEKIYGVSQGGGLNGDGVLFQYDLNTNTYNVIHSFEETTGNYATAAPIEVEPGILYGTTSECDSYEGVIYKFVLADSTYTVLHHFNSGTGSLPFGSLVFEDGKLLGMTYGGGENDCGVIFQFDIQQEQYLDLYHFTNTDGSYPYGGLTIASSGRVFGLTSQGGDHDNGTIFEFDLENQEMLQIISLQSDVNGGGLYGNLVEAPNGMLYITTSWGGEYNNGTILEFNPDEFTVSTKVHFISETTGRNVYGSLTLSSNGLLYGMCKKGGENNTGTLFCYDPEQDLFEVLAHYTQVYSWEVTDVDEIIYPIGTPLIASNGKLYGLTSDGGTTDYGTLFEYDFNQNALRVLLNFESSINGQGPHKAPIQYDKYTLYGATPYGGRYNHGVFYKYNMVSREHTPLHHFKYSESGSTPSSELIIAENGRIYGITANGGEYNLGTIYEFNPEEETLIKLHDLTYANGNVCFSHMLEVEQGVLYGVMGYSGNNDRGTLFKFDYNQHEFTTIRHFADATGGHPNSSFYQAPNGLLYGTTMFGGQYSNGVVYSFNPETNEYSVVYNFTQGDDIGRGPLGNLIPDGDGSFYGIAHGYTYGGAEDRAIYKFSTETNTYTHLKQLPWGNGWQMVNLTKVSNGKMYGTTYFGTGYNDGVLFEYDPDVNELQNKHTFSGITGEHPYYPTLLEVLTPKVSHQNIQICFGDSIYIQNDFQFESGLYIDTLITAFGNDSIVFTNLYVHQIDLSVTENTNSLTAIAEGEYQWLNCFDFSPIYGANEQTFSPETFGSFAVEITQNGCVDTTACYYVTPIGVETIYSSYSYSVYPIPTSDYLYISFDSEKIERIFVYDINGKTVNDKIKINNNSITVSSLPEGIYFITIETIDNKRLSSKFIKN